MDFELDFSSENSTMTSFLELEQEIREAPLLSEPLVRPSVIVKPRHKPTVQPSLSDIMDSCGIEYDLPGDCNANISSPSSIHSDVQLEQNRELIDELEEFFINTDGKPTVVDDCEELLDDQYSPAGSGLVTADGQNVIIIIAPSSPTESVSTSVQDQTDSDPEWSPSPASPGQWSLLASKAEQAKPRKKYARSKPPTPPAATPYPADKKERKKAQNRTAAFRYREKKKSELDLAEEELEALADKNTCLKEKLTEMETEFKYLKKLMVEAGQIYHGRQLLKHQYKLSSRSENYLVLVGQFPTVGLKQLYFCFHLHQMDC